MSRRAGLMAGLVLLLAPVPPAAAKSPELATVRGPGMAGEVDLAGVLGDETPLLLPVSRGLADSATGPPPGDPGRGYVFTWYSVGGMPPEPALDRVVYHPDATGGPAIEVVSVSELFVPAHALGWHRLDPGRATVLDGAVAVASDGAVGAERYEFAGVEHAEATGEWWVPVPLPSSAAVAADASAPSDRPAFVDGGVVLAAALAGTGGVIAVARRVRRAGNARPSDTFAPLNRVPGR